MLFFFNKKLCLKILCSFTYSSSYNLTPAISQVLIGRRLIFCSPTWPPCCNSPRKCTPVKYKVRQNLFNCCCGRSMSCLQNLLRFGKVNFLFNYTMRVWELFCWYFWHLYQKKNICIKRFLITFHKREFFFFFS